jgi:hypothetical protein
VSVSSPATTSAALAEKRMYDVAGACGLVADPSRGIALCRLDPLDRLILGPVSL